MTCVCPRDARSVASPPLPPCPLPSLRAPSAPPAPPFPSWRTTLLRLFRAGVRDPARARSALPVAAPSRSEAPHTRGRTPTQRRPRKGSTARGARRGWAGARAGTNAATPERRPRATRARRTKPPRHVFAHRDGAVQRFFARPVRGAPRGDRRCRAPSQEPVTGEMIAFRPPSGSRSGRKWAPRLPRARDPRRRSGHRAVARTAASRPSGSALGAHVPAVSQAPSSLPFTPPSAAAHSARRAGR